MHGGSHYRPCLSLTTHTISGAYKGNCFPSLFTWMLLLWTHSVSNSTSLVSQLGCTIQRLKRNELGCGCVPPLMQTESALPRQCVDVLDNISRLLDDLCELSTTQSRLDKCQKLILVSQLPTAMLISICLCDQIQNHNLSILTIWGCMSITNYQYDYCGPKFKSCALGVPLVSP